MQYIVQETHSDIAISKAITNLRSDLETTKRELKADIAAVNTRLSALDSRVVNVEDDNTEIKTITTELEKQLTEIRTAYYYNIANKVFQLVCIIVIIVIIVYLIS
jgi:dynactin complex subunit